MELIVEPFIDSLEFSVLSAQILLDVLVIYNSRLALVFVEQGIVQSQNSSDVSILQIKRHTLMKPCKSICACQ